MRGRITEVLAVSTLAAIITLTIAAPVLRAPSERVFGMEIVGRHHDPFTVMAQFERPIAIGVYSQPVTDVTGALLERVAGAVAAYNWLVLLTFPLSAAAAYLLARHLALSPAGATVVALAFAFSPFHLAHAAYHPHIAQTQWVPLYLLALWSCLDGASPAAVAFLCAAAVAVTLSNFYGGLIAAVITPVAVVAYWLLTRRGERRPIRPLVITLASLVLIAAAGVVYVAYAAGGVVANRAAFAFSRDDLFRYSAKWWGYLVPPVENPLLGGVARRVWDGAGVREGLLEQQVSLGWGIVALGLIAVVRWLVSGNDARRAASLRHVPMLVVVAVAALVCSLSPEREIGWFTFVRPSALLYDVVPMFRSYARFGVVVQLMAALLAGIGVDWLLRTATTRARIACVALVAIAAGEYAVTPSATWRDALPTAAHRWVMRRAGPVRALDCTPLTAASESVRWLSRSRIQLQDESIGDCLEPHLAQKLSATGYTHLLARRDSADGQWFAEHPPPDGVRVAARFDGGLVFEVTAEIPAIYTATMTAFFPREHDSEWSWRWMGGDASWTIVNTRAAPTVTTLAVELSAFQRARHVELRLDGRPMQTLIVDSPRRVYRIGPLTVPAGVHELVFHPAELPTVAGDVIANGDPRPLSFAVGTWTWQVGGDQR